jgi:uncharacterized protein (TIGR02597 family)
MKTKQITCLCTALLFSSVALALEDVSTPLGAVKIMLPYGPYSSMISVPLKAFAIARLPVGTFSANTITFVGSPLGTTQLTTPGAPFFVSFTSGRHAGRYCLVTANTSNSVTLDIKDGTGTELALNTTGFSLTSGDKLEIVPGDTLASLFGLGAELKINGGNNAASADTVGIWNGATFVYYFYRSTPGYGYWVAAADTATNANHTILYPDQGLSVTRKAGRPATTLTFIGAVPVHRSGLRHPGASSRLVAQPLPVPVSLSYFAFTTQGGLKTGGSALSADTVGVWNGVQWIYHYQNNSGAWLTAGKTGDQRNLLIQPGTSVTILRRQPKTPGESILGELPPYLPSL